MTWDDLLSLIFILLLFMLLLIILLLILLLFEKIENAIERIF